MKRKQALRGRNHAEGWLGGRIDALKIPARTAECSLTENATSPFQAEPTHLRALCVLSPCPLCLTFFCSSLPSARVSLAAKNEVNSLCACPASPTKNFSPASPKASPSPPSSSYVTSLSSATPAARTSSKVPSPNPPAPGLFP